ncbi:hypothetical protein THRCLA_07656, partial [Thraustotheca clavata]
TRPVIYIMEPDAVGLALKDDCGKKSGYIDNMSKAIPVLSGNNNSLLYVDVGYWMLETEYNQTMVKETLKQFTTEGRVTGIALDTSNYRNTSEMTAMCESFGNMTGNNYHCVIDTSRNYRGPKSGGEWCNSRYAALGVPSTNNTANNMIDYFLWLKTPGESDGACVNNGDDALKGGGTPGQFFPKAFSLMWDRGYFVDVLKIAKFNEYSDSVDLPQTGGGISYLALGIIIACCVVFIVLGIFLKRRYDAKQARRRYVNNAVTAPRTEEAGTRKPYLSLKKYPRSSLDPLPSLKLGRYDSTYLEMKYAEFDAYIAHLLALDAVSTCDLLNRFLRDDSSLLVSDASDEEDAVVDATTVTIRKGESYSISLEVPTPNAAISYHFTTRKHDIGFTITLNEETLQVYSREVALKGLVRCSNAGICTLTWDNSYVWHRSKVVTYHAEIVLMSPRTQSPKKTGINEAVDGNERHTGFIEHTQRTSLLLSPRRLVNTSMRRIIGWDKHEAWLKAGSMIIQRTKVKKPLVHAADTWYRKWFTLDGANGVLRCYDNQASVTREGPQARLKLAASNTSLSVADARQLHGPTPYIFTVQRGKTMWILCTETEEDFSSWHQAISKSIFLVNWSAGHENGAKSDDDEENDV